MPPPDRSDGYDRRRPRDPVTSIASTSNDLITYVRSLYRANIRRKERLFVVEGVRALEDALASGGRPEVLLVAPDQLERTPRGAELRQKLAPFRTVTVTDAVLKSISDTVTPQGVIAVFPIPAPPQNPIAGPMVLILDGVRDPGNAGTILRSADASGVVRAVVFVNSVDAYAPKVVRAGMGAHFRMTILDGVEWSWLSSRIADRQVLLSATVGGEAYDRVDWSRESAIILGGEAEGASTEAEAAATARITIPMASSSESLNAAMAGTVLLFEAARQQRSGSRSKSRTEPVQASDENLVRAPSMPHPTGPRLAPPRRDAPTGRSVRAPQGPSAGKSGPGRRQTPPPKARAPSVDKTPSEPPPTRGASGPRPPHLSDSRTRRRPRL